MWYFFTQQEKKRAFREAGFGYWKATGGGKVVRYNGAVVGYRRPFVFYEGKPPMGKKTKWILHEFRINESSRQKKNATHMTVNYFCFRFLCLLNIFSDSHKLLIILFKGFLLLIFYIDSVCFRKLCW